MTDWSSPVPEQELRILCREMEKTIAVPPELFDRFDVKRGLRNRDGTGVMAGLTKVCSVEGYYIEDGERVPMEGRLCYRGVNVLDIVEGCQRENRFGYEEAAWLLLFGSLPTSEELKGFREVIGNARDLPDDFIQDMIMKAPSPNIMNKLARSVLAL